MTQTNPSKQKRKRKSRPVKWCKCTALLLVLQMQNVGAKGMDVQESRMTNPSRRQLAEETAAKWTSTCRFHTASD